uniref:Uncharacterized protein n=1 Tax=Schlesneria paludicola TaxID=360056 RepID=A0A7C2P1L4_9PLAN
MSIGLDLGSTQFRSLRRQGDRLVGRACRLEYASLPDSTHHRRLLDRDQVAYADCDGALILLGDEAAEWSRVLRAPLQQLLLDGQLPANDVLSRQILSLMLDAVLPTPSFADEVCCLTVPGELLPEDDGPQRGFFRRLVMLRGYRPRFVGQGLAVALAELGDAGFTGLGISLGASQCEFALVRSGQEHGRCAIPWGVAEIVTDQLSDPLITEFLVELLIEAGLRIGQHDGFRLLTQPVAVACAGGLTMRPGFERLWQQAWQRAAWPIQVRSLRVSTDAAYTVARGCLIQAKLAAQPNALRAAA